jgi:hypothetical protein
MACGAMIQVLMIVMKMMMMMENMMMVKLMMVRVMDEDEDEYDDEEAKMVITVKPKNTKKHARSGVECRLQMPTSSTLPAW